MMRSLLVLALCFLIQLTNGDTVRRFSVSLADALRHEDPEVHMDATHLITSKGYPCENHWVTTQDGYILNLIRIPHGRHGRPSAISTGTRPVILLQHGLLTSATNFLTNLVDESLAYLLADAGADVWMGNSRGNIYSRNHTTLSPKKVEFWEFSWDEMGKYDVPANVEYIRKATGQDKIFYAGHSQGTTQAFAAFSENMTLASHIKLFIAMAPVARVGHMISPIRKLSPFAKEINKFYDLFGHGAFTFSQSVKDFLAEDLCIDKTLCRDAIFLLAGFNSKSFNTSRIPVYVGHNPAGTSTQDLLHWAQGVLSNRFQKFDYGSKSKNKKYYGQATPPLYNVSKMKVPVAMFTAGQDWLADPVDVAWLLPQVNVISHVNVDYYNHLDFLWATDAPKMIYNHIISLVMNG